MDIPITATWLSCSCGGMCPSSNVKKGREFLIFVKGLMCIQSNC